MQYSPLLVAKNIIIATISRTKRCLIGLKLGETIEGQKSTGVLSPHVFTKKSSPGPQIKYHAPPKMLSVSFYRARQSIY